MSEEGILKFPVYFLAGRVSRNQESGLTDFENVSFLRAGATRKSAGNSTQCIPVFTNKTNASFCGSGNPQVIQNPKEFISLLEQVRNRFGTSHVAFDPLEADVGAIAAFAIQDVIQSLEGAKA